MEHQDKHHEEPYYEYFDEYYPREIYPGRREDVTFTIDETRENSNDGGLGGIGGGLGGLEKLLGNLVSTGTNALSGIPILGGLLGGASKPSKAAPDLTAICGMLCQIDKTKLAGICTCQ